MQSWTRSIMRHLIAHGNFRKAAIAIAVGSSYSWISQFSAIAQSIIPDQTLPVNERSQASPIVPSTDLITGGATRDSNLFHSFQQFNIDTGRSAYFLNPGNIQNIFSRVTGSRPSEIFGTLGTIQFSNGTFVPTNANLFLINPNGILFGPGARLDLAGSFVATTASAIQFGNQGIFSAINPTAPNLLTVNPSAFLFNQIAAQPIVVQSTTPDLTQPNQLAILAVNPNRSLLLVGGDIRLEAGFLEAASSRIELAGLAGAGTLGLNAETDRLSLKLPTDAPRADVVFNNSSSAIVTEPGEISIYARNLDILNGSRLSATDGIGNPGEISLQASDRILIDSAILNSGILGETSGKSGNLSIIGRSLALNNSTVLADSSGQDAGVTLLQATDAVSIRNSIIRSFLLGFAGRGGDISVQAGALTVDNSTLSTSTFGRGDAGNVALRAKDAITLTNSSLISSGVVALPELGIVGIGKSGSIQIDSAALSLDRNSSVSTSTFGIGDAGSLSINVTDSVRVDNSTISSNVAPGAIGNGGDTRIQAANLSLLNRARLATGTAGTGDAGALTLQATNEVQLLGDSIISSSVQAGGIGKAGAVTVQARSLLLTDGSQIQSALAPGFDNFSAGQGQGGKVRIQAADFVQLSGANVQGFPSSLTTIADVGTQGRAGDIEVATQNLQIRDRATITAETRNADPGGSILLQVDNLDINNGSVRTTANSSGNAGTINVEANTVQIQNGNIAAAAAQSGGGRIAVAARDMRLRDRSLINTNVAQGASGGGDIGIDANTVLVLEDSDILANANQGRGGNITIQSAAFIADLFSKDQANAVRYTGDITPFRGNSRVDISASSAVGISGSVTIPDFSFLQDDLTQLPQSLIDPSTLLANSCIVRSRDRGSFVITGAGGLAERPGDDAIAAFPTGEVRSGRSPDAIVEPQSLYRLANGQLVLSRDCQQ